VQLAGFNSPASHAKQRQTLSFARDTNQRLNVTSERKPTQHL
jgi:hypothetical protein